MLISELYCKVIPVNEGSQNKWPYITFLPRPKKCHLRSWNIYVILGNLHLKQNNAFMLSLFLVNTGVLHESVECLIPWLTTGFGPELSFQKMIQWLTHTKSHLHIVEWISIFELIGWMNDTVLIVN